MSKCCRWPWFKGLKWKGSKCHWIKKQIGQFHIQHLIWQCLYPKLQSNTYHLKQSQESFADIVKVDLTVLPRVTDVCHIQAVLLRLYDVCRDLITVTVNTLPELAGEELDTHDAEDEPEDHTNKQHIHNGRDGHHQGIHNNLGENKIRQLICLTDLKIFDRFKYIWQFKNIWQIYRYTTKTRESTLSNPWQSFYFATSKVFWWVLKLKGQGETCDCQGQDYFGFDDI